MASGTEFTFLDHFTKGVYGEHARINHDFNGGPKCAEQLSISFTLGTIAFLVSIYQKIIENNNSFTADADVYSDYPSWTYTASGWIPS